MTEGGIWGPGDRDSSRSLFGRPSPCLFGGALPSFIRPAPPKPRHPSWAFLESMAWRAPHQHRTGHTVCAEEHSFPGFLTPPSTGSEAGGGGGAGAWEGSSAPSGRSGGGRSGGGRSGTDGGTHRGRGSRSRAGQARVPGRACPAWGRDPICAGGSISFGTASSAAAAHR